ncbi:MAG: hypothetical protein ACXQS2_04290 [Methermicoccaceae archaeon]
MLETVLMAICVIFMALAVAVSVGYSIVDGRRRLAVILLVFASLFAFWLALYLCIGGDV